jgi:hypothetical protein
LEEFRRVRTPIDAALVELRTERLALNSLATSGHSLEELRAEVAYAEKRTVQAYVKLTDALDAADASAYSEGSDWQSTTEAHWEAVASDLNSVYNPNKAENEARTAISYAVTHMDDLNRAVNGRIDAELQKFTVKPRGRWGRTE